MTGFLLFILFMLVGSLATVSWMYLSKTNIPIQVIELETRVSPHPEDEESIRALKTHPGFIALTNRYKLKVAVLKDTLIKYKHEDLRHVDRLQALIEAYQFLDSDVNKAVFKRKEAVAVSTIPYEQAEFEKAFALIQSV